MIRIYEVTQITLPTGGVHYAGLWQNTEKQRKPTDDQFDGVIELGSGDAKTLISQSTREQEVPQPAGGKVVKYFFD